MTHNAMKTIIILLRTKNRRRINRECRLLNHSAGRANAGRAMMRWAHSPVSGSAGARSAGCQSEPNAPGRVRLSNVWTDQALRTAACACAPAFSRGRVRETARQRSCEPPGAFRSPAPFHSLDLTLFASLPPNAGPPRILLDGVLKPRSNGRLMSSPREQSLPRYSRAPSRRFGRVARSEGQDSPRHTRAVLSYTL